MRTGLMKGKCISYLFRSNYFLHLRKYSWTEAAQWCEVGPWYEWGDQAQGGHLVEIRTVEQMQYITALLRYMDDGGTRKYWTGATDANREGQWYWSNSLTEVGPFVWWSEFPQYNKYGNCGMVKYCGKGCPDNYKMWDYYCSSLYYPLCQVGLFQFH